MLLRQTFADPEVNLVLELFLRLVTDFFGGRLVSVMLHGSILFDDLAPGYGDLDFVAVVERDLSADQCQRLVELREPLRSGTYGLIATMVEGVFLPRHMLDPDVRGTALWWGTSGERTWTQSELGWLVLHTIRKRGVVVWGEDLRHGIPQASPDALGQEAERFCSTMRAHGHGGTLHSIDWLLTAARLLLWIREGRLCSKSEAAAWGHLHAEGDWRHFLPRARELRLAPSLVNDLGTKEWLDGLAAPIQAACDELEHELARWRALSDGSRSEML